MAATPPANLATNDLIDETWVDAVRASIVEMQPTAWTAVTFQNGWVNFPAAQPVQYRKIGDMVYVRGGTKSGVSGTVAFTFPVGFRAPAPLYFSALVSGAVAGGYVTVSTDGTVAVFTPNNAQVDLGSLQFSVTP